MLLLSSEPVKDGREVQERNIGKGINYFPAPQAPYRLPRERPDRRFELLARPRTLTAGSWLAFNGSPVVRRGDVQPGPSFVWLCENDTVLIRPRPRGNHAATTKQEVGARITIVGRK